MPRPTSKNTFSVGWDCLRDSSEWPISTEAGMKGLERSGSPYTALHCHSLPALQTEQRWCCTQGRHWFLPLSLDRFSASLDAQRLYFNVSTPAVGRERRSPELARWAGGVAWNAQSSTVPAAQSCQPAPALLCLGQTGTGGANSGHFREPALSQPQATTLLLGTDLELCLPLWVWCSRC